MGARGVAGLLGVWLASTMTADARPGPDAEREFRQGARPKGVRRPPAAMSRRRTRKAAPGATRETEGPRRPATSEPARGDTRAPPASSERPGASIRLPPGVLQAGASGPHVERTPSVPAVASTPAANGRVERPRAVTTRASTSTSTGDLAHLVDAPVER